jgi:DNA polymerase-3 subunit alpha
MAVITLDDGRARVEMTVFNETFEANRHWLKEDVLVVVEGRVMADEFSGGFRVSADKIFDLAAARNRFKPMIRIRCNGGSSGQKLRQLLEPYRPGPCPVSIVYTNGAATCELRLSDEWRVNASDNLVQSLAEWVTEPNVEIVYP